MQQKVVSHAAPQEVPKKKKKNKHPLPAEAAPKIRAWLQEEAKNALAEVVPAVFAGVEKIIQQQWQALNSMSARLEAVLHALPKYGVLSESQIEVAFQEFVAFRTKLREVLDLTDRARYDAVMAWNAKEGVKKITPFEAGLHQWLMQDPTLSVEEALAVGHELGLGEGYLAAVSRRITDRIAKIEAAAKLQAEATPEGAPLEPVAEVPVSAEVSAT